MPSGGNSLARRDLDDLHSLGLGARKRAPRERSPHGWGCGEALLAVRAARAGVFLSETTVVCRQLFVTRTIPLHDVRTVQMIEFSGFFIAGFLRSVAVLRRDGVRHRVALASGRPDMIRRCVREFKSALGNAGASGTSSR